MQAEGLGVAKRHSVLIGLELGEVVLHVVRGEVVLGDGVCEGVIIITRVLSSAVVGDEKQHVSFSLVGRHDAHGKLNFRKRISDVGVGHTHDLSRGSTSTHSVERTGQHVEYEGQHEQYRYGDDWSLVWILELSLQFFLTSRRLKHLASFGNEIIEIINTFK